MRRHLAWPIALPLAVIGTLAGHSLGYWAAVPDTHTRERVLASSGHGYLDYAPVVVGICIAVVFLAFVAAVATAFAGRESARRARIKLVAAVPPLAFVVQEFLERYAHDGGVPWAFVLSAPFALGLVAQLPFALLVLALAYALGRVAERLGAALAARRLGRIRKPAARTSLLEIDLPRRSALARGYSGRGPPLVVAA